MRNATRSRATWPTLFSLIAVLVTPFVVTQTATADGMFVKERLQKKIPAIPWQRALITYKDGVEHLMIQSAVDADGATLGWIIPVPSVPTDIAKGSAGAIQVLSMRLKPWIIDADRYLNDRLTKYLWLAFICGVWAIWLLVGYPTWKRLIISIPVAGAVAILPWLFQGGLYGTPKAAGMDDRPSRSTVIVEATAQVGSYEVATLKAEKAEDLRTWLSDSGFSDLPSNGDTIVRQYIAEGWHFVAAKLKREGDGVAVPHPLAITFPSERAVYPMRLTSLSASDVYLELFIVAEGAASQEPLTRECCDEVSYHEYMGYRFGYFLGSEIVSSKGNPVLDALLWKGAVITKLSGRVRPDEMRNDFSPQFTPYKHYIQKLYTRGAVIQFAWIWTCRVWSVAIFAGVLLLYPVILRNPRRQPFALRGLGALSFTLAALGGAAAFLLLPATEVVERPRVPYHLRSIAEQLQILADGHGGFVGAPPDKIAAICRAHFVYTNARNPYTGKRVEFDDAPGDVSIEQDGDTVVVQTYSSRGAPIGTLRLPAAPDASRSKTYLADEWTGRDEDLQALEDTIKNWQGRPQSRGISPPVEGWGFTCSLCLCQRDPERFFPLIRDSLKSLVEQNSQNTELMNFDVSALGLMTWTVPPLDVTDRAAMQKFLDTISAFQLPQEAPAS